MHYVQSHNLSPHGGPAVGMPGSQGAADMRVPLPTPHLGQGISWHQPSANYTSELPQGRQSWDFSYMDPSGASGAAQTGHYNRIPSISQSLGFPVGSAYYMSPQDYKDFNQRTTHA